MALADIGHTALCSAPVASDEVVSCAPGMTIDKLPEEVMLRILSMLPLNELTEVIPKVSRHWEQLAHDWELWHHEVYHTKECDSDSEVVGFLQQWTQVQNVIFRNKVGSSVFRALCNCKYLTNLQFSCAQKVNNEWLQALVENCQNIKSLIVPPTFLLDESNARTLAQLQQLESLTIIQGSITVKCVSEDNLFVIDPCLEKVIHLSPLADGCLNLNSLEIFVHLAPLPNLEYFFKTKHNTLESLTIPWATHSDRCVTPLLNACTSLRHLQLLNYSPNWDVVPEDFAALGRVSSLHSLTMHYVQDSPRGALALAFKHGGLSQLQELDISHSDTEGSAAVVAICRGCPALKKLILTGCSKISNEALKELHRLTALEVLDLSFCDSLTSEAIQYVSQLSALREFYLIVNNLSQLEDGLLLILEIVSLEKLYLGNFNNCSFPFNIISKKLINLRYLRVEGLRGRSRKLERLKKQRPNLRVLRTRWY